MLKKYEPEWNRIVSACVHCDYPVQAAFRMAHIALNDGKLWEFKIAGLPDKYYLINFDRQLSHRAIFTYLDALRSGNAELMHQPIIIRTVQKMIFTPHKVTNTWVEYPQGCRPVITVRPEEVKGIPPLKTKKIENKLKNWLFDARINKMLEELKG